MEITDLSENNKANFKCDFELRPEKTCFTVTKQISAAFETHFHSFYEIYYFVAGDADYLVEGKEYHLTPHSLILLSPNVFHGVRVNTNADYIRCAVHFSPQSLSPERRTLLLASFPGNKKKALQEAFYEHTQNFGLALCLEHLLQAGNQPEPYKDTFYCIFLEALLARISLMCQTLHPAMPTSTVSGTISDIIFYLNEHLTETITLDDLSKQFFISKYYMNRAFKRATGTTVMDYVIYKRIVMAKQLILNGYSAKEAAAHAGFGDYSVFYRSYRKIMNCSPGSDKP